MENAPASARDELRADLRLARETTAAGVVPSRDRTAQRTWVVWCTFCSSVNADPFMSKVADPIILLQLFGVRWRDGRISPSGEPNRARSVEDAIRFVGQKFSSLGAPDPRLDSVGKQDFRLRRMYAAWKKEDDPPARVEPVPMIILLRAHDMLDSTNEKDKATMDCIWMAFYFLLRPGEYVHSSSDSKTPFRLADVEFKLGGRHFFDAHIATTLQLISADVVSLTFTNQKNGVKGEKLAHAANGNSHSCPVRATLRRVAHLNSHSAPPSTPLYTYYSNGRQFRITSVMITSVLRAAALTIPGYAGVQPDNIATRSLRSSGAMALLLGGIDPDRIRILGRWRSDAMYRYLHSHALPLIRNNSRLMFSGGHYDLVTRTRTPLD